MALGRKLGRTFVQLSKAGKRIDKGLDRLLGENRTKPGDGMSQNKALKRAELDTKRNKAKDFSIDTGSSNSFFSSKSSKDKDQKFF